MNRPRLSEHTTLRVGGAADAWITADSEPALVAAVVRADRDAVPVLVLGGGSNLLVADAGFPGVVIEVAIPGIAIDEDGSSVDLVVGAGVEWDAVVALAVARGWSGVEALSGIPGRTGATPIQNVGAYGQDVSQVITSVRALDRRSGSVVDLVPGDCGFGYRTSVFKRDPDRWVIVSVAMRLAPHGLGTVRYGELAGALGVAVGGEAPVAAIRTAVLALRSGKGMVLDDADHDTWSAGSFFTNPVVRRGCRGVRPRGVPALPGRRRREAQRRMADRARRDREGVRAGVAGPGRHVQQAHPCPDESGRGVRGGRAGTGPSDPGAGGGAIRDHAPGRGAHRRLLAVTDGRRRTARTRSAVG